MPLLDDLLPRPLSDFSCVYTEHEVIVIAHNGVRGHVDCKGRREMVHAIDDALAAIPR